MAIDTSIRQRIRDAVIAALNGGADSPAMAVKARTDAFAPEELPKYLVRFVDESGSLASRATAARALTFRIECHVSGAAPDDLLEPLLVYAVSTIFADAPLAALVERIDEPHLGWDLEGGYLEGGLAYIDVPVMFTTQRGDPTVGK